MFRVVCDVSRVRSCARELWFWCWVSLGSVSCSCSCCCTCGPLAPWCPVHFSLDFVFFSFFMIHILHVFSFLPLPCAFESRPWFRASFFPTSFSAVWLVFSRYVYVKVVEDSPATLSLGRFCDKMGDSYIGFQEGTRDRPAAESRVSVAPDITYHVSL